VNGERRPPPSRDLHRLSADRGARSQASYENDAKLQDKGARDGRIDAGVDEQDETSMPAANAS
jgi:hypothetical protein